MENTFVGVADVIEAIKRELRAAQEVVIGPPELELAGVELEIKSVVTKSAKGEVKTGILPMGLSGSLSGKIKDDQIQRVRLVLEPPEVEMLKAAPADLSKLDIANTIVTLRRELHKGLSSQPQLLPKNLDIEVSFAVLQSAEGGGGINLIFIKFGGGGDYLNECVQKIILHFNAPRLPQ